MHAFVSRWHFGWLCLLLLLPVAWRARPVGTRLYAEPACSQTFIGEAFKVAFVIEEAHVGRFTPPDWDGAGFAVTSGPDFAVISQPDGSYTMYYRYAVAPFDTGRLHIPTAYFRIDDTEYSSTPVPVISRYRE
jgi:BatD DUF11 like domain